MATALLWLYALTSTLAIYLTHTRAIYLAFTLVLILGVLLAPGARGVCAGGNRRDHPRDRLELVDLHQL